jgi:hypothetical protein
MIFGVTSLALENDDDDDDDDDNEEEEEEYEDNDESILLLVVYNVSFGLSPVCVHYWVTIESCHS